MEDKSIVALDLALKSSNPGHMMSDMQMEQMPTVDPAAEAEVIRAAWLEDTGTMENTYEAMLSRAKDKQWLMNEEVLIRHQSAVIETMAS